MTSLQVQGQIDMDFGSQNDFPSGWSGDTTLFSVSDGKLNLTATGFPSPAFISYPSSAIYKAQWELDIDLDFNPSGSNFSRIYIVADTNILEEINEGLFIRIGGTEDDVRLYEISDGLNNLLIDGADGRLNLSNVSLHLTVNYDSLGNLNLWSQLDAEVNPVLEGTAFLVPELLPTHFAVECIFTPTRADKFHFDNFHVEGAALPDISPPELLLVDILDSVNLELLFSETVTPAAGFENESIQIFAPNQSSLAVDALYFHETKVHIRLSQNLWNGFKHSLSISNISDSVQNTINPDTIQILYFEEAPVEPGDIIINEIMADPYPPEELVETEYFEILNVSNKPIALHQLVVSDVITTSMLPEFILLPDSIITFSKDPMPSITGNQTLSPWPTLNNAYDTLLLYDPTGVVIDSVFYASSYHEDSKKEGGWSLELVRPDVLCPSQKWKSSVNAMGGTPGLPNSVSYVVDTFPPTIQFFEVSGSGLLVNLNENISQIEGIFNTSTLDSIEIEGWQIADSSIVVLFAQDAISSALLQLAFVGLTDCDGNSNSDTIEVYFDNQPPIIESIHRSGINQYQIHSNEPITATALTIHIQIDSITIPVDVVMKDSMILVASYQEIISQPSMGVWHLDGLADQTGNINHGLTIPFLFESTPIPQFGDLLITEIMFDPYPPTDLPDTEYVEILNLTMDTLFVAGVVFGDDTDAGIVTTGILPPKEFMLLTSTSGVEHFQHIANVQAVSPWPNLSSQEDNLALFNQSGNLISSQRYSKSWIHDETKNNGGWALELIDSSAHCLDSMVWAVSEHPSGGTPGNPNSHDPNKIPPMEIAMQLTTSDSTILKLNRALEIGWSDIKSNTIPTAQVTTHILDEFRILVIHPDLPSKTLFEITLSGLRDCTGFDYEISLNIYSDFKGPEITSVEFIDATILRLVFDEAVDSETKLADFLIAPSSVQPQSIVRSPVDTRILEITIHGAETAEEAFLSFIVADTLGNFTEHEVSVELPLPRIPAQYEVLITEIMTTPSGSDGTINSEYIEIFNTTDEDLLLVGCRLSDGNNMTTLGYTIIEARQYLVLAPNGKEMEFSPVDPVSLSNWPGFNKSHDRVVLTNHEGTEIHEVSYNRDWYDNELKSEGGWSLEMIDSANPCGEDTNWTASVASSGGTPGGDNSVKSMRPDVTGPSITKVVADIDQVSILFDEKIASNSLSKASFSISPFTEIAGATLSSSRNEVAVTLHGELSKSVLYQIKIEGITDCVGNLIPNSASRQDIVIPHLPKAGDLHINEILFDPFPGGEDFIELYNPTSSYFNLQNCALINKHDTVELTEKIVLSPNSIIAFTENRMDIISRYHNVSESSVYNAITPSLPDEMGYIGVLNQDRELVDDFDYTADLHMGFIRDPEGISLERISYESINYSHSWKSATESAGWATPGLRNSQTLNMESTEAMLVIEPRVFDPFSQSGNNFATMKLNFDKPGYVATIDIYDLAGRRRKQVENNVFLSQNSYVTWDGTDETGSVVTGGYYLILIQAVSPEGSLVRLKDKIAVVRAF